MHINVGLHLQVAGVRGNEAVVTQVRDQRLLEFVAGFAACRSAPYTVRNTNVLSLHGFEELRNTSLSTLKHEKRAGRTQQRSSWKSEVVGEVKGTEPQAEKEGKFSEGCQA